MTDGFSILLQSVGSQIALMAIVVAGLSIYMIATRNRVRKSMNQPRGASRERYEELSRRTQLTRDLEEVMNDLDELARQVNGKLDVRFAKLEAVIRDADERIDQLNRLLRRASGRDTIDVTVSEDATAGDPAPGGGDVVPPSGTPDRAVGKDAQHAEVYNLADRGLNAVDIAEQTKRTAGEVELILALRRARLAADAIKKPRETVGNT